MLAEISSAHSSNQGKDILIPMFYRRAVQDKLSSEKEGRPIFREEDYIQIHIPGDKNTIIDRKVRDDDRKRWAVQWQAYVDNATQPINGTPLEQWPALSVSQIAELKALHVPTIEVLSELPESGLQKIGMGAREMQARARAFLEVSKNNGVFEKIAAENTRLQDQIEMLSKNNQELEKRLEQLQEQMNKQQNKSKKA